MNGFSEKAKQSLNGYYVYALIDPRNDKVFYIGKGVEDRVFSHEIESGKNYTSEKIKLKTIREIESEGLRVKRVIVNWEMSENEAFAAEAALINMINFMSGTKLSNIVSGHHSHECVTVEDFEKRYGAEPLSEEEIKHNILVIKINKYYDKNMSEKELYDAIRGFWKASMKNIKERNIEYVFGVYNQLIVGVYKPDEWHYVYEMKDIPRSEEVTEEIYESIKNRLYFVCNNFEEKDENQKFYIHKSIAGLKVNQSAQNPITYLMKPK